MLCPETSTYAALPPSDSGRTKCAQKRKVRTASAIHAAFPAISKDDLLLIVDHEGRLVRRRLARVEDSLVKRCRCVSIADPSAEGGGGCLDEGVDVGGHRD